MAALSGLHQAEISANIGELQATTTIVLGMLAYLASTIYFIGSLRFSQLVLLPIGVFFGCAYQMLRAAVVVRRAALARVYERELLGVVAVRNKMDFDARETGSGYYGSLDDIGLIQQGKERGWVSRAFVAIVAYMGLYGLSMSYTGLVLFRSAQVSDDVWLTSLVCAAYAAAWLGLLAAARTLFPNEHTTTPSLAISDSTAAEDS